MILVLRLYFAKSERVNFLVDSLMTGVIHQMYRHQYPSYIGTDVLRNSSDPSEILALSFWTSADGYTAAKNSHNFAAMSRFLGKLTTSTVHLGEYFSIPDRLTPHVPSTGLNVEADGRSQGGASSQAEHRRR